MTLESINILMLLGYGEVLLNSAKGSSKLFTVLPAKPTALSSCDPVHKCLITLPWIWI